MVGKGSGTGDRQVDRRTLAVQVLRICVHLIQNQIPDRDRPQSRRAVGADHQQQAAGEILLRDRVVAVPTLGRRHALLQLRAILDQRVDAPLGQSFDHFVGWLHEHGGRRRYVHGIAYKIAGALGSANLRGLDKDNFTVRIVNAQAIHDVAQVRGTARSVLSRFCGADR